MPRKTIHLVGHGWPNLNRAQNPVFQAAAALTERGYTVEASFMKQEPVFTQAEDDSVVVPFFLSNGFFASKVAGMAPNAKVTLPVGCLPGLDRMVDSIANQLDLTWASLVIVGHGTPRHGQSRDTVLAQVARLSERGLPCSAAFLDDIPSLDEQAGQWQGPVILLPFFVAAGPHTQVDIPEAIRGSHAEITITEPLGNSPAIVDIIEAALAF